VFVGVHLKPAKAVKKPDKKTDKTGGSIFIKEVLL